MTVTYTHNSLKYDGQHNLPIIVKLDNGKSFYIDLVGVTLPVKPTQNMTLNKKRSSTTAAASTTSIVSVDKCQYTMKF